MVQRMSVLFIRLCTPSVTGPVFIVYEPIVSKLPTFACK